MVTNATYQGDEFSRRGQEILDREIQPKLSTEDIDQFIAIDILSGDYEIDPNDFEATQRLIAKQPNAKIWLARVGQRAAYRIGRDLFSGGHK